MAVGVNQGIESTSWPQLAKVASQVSSPGVRRTACCERSSSVTESYWAKWLLLVLHIYNIFYALSIRLLSKHELLDHAEHVTALCTHRPSLLLIKTARESSVALLKKHGNAGREW